MSAVSVGDSGPAFVAGTGLADVRSLRAEPAPAERTPERPRGSVVARIGVGADLFAGEFARLPRDCLGRRARRNVPGCALTSELAWTAPIARDANRHGPCSEWPVEESGEHVVPAYME